MGEAHVAELDLRAEVHDVEDLVGEFARVDVVAVRVVGDERDVERADVWNEREALEEVVLRLCQYQILDMT